MSDDRLSDDKFREKFGEYIFILRNSKNMTMLELAKKAGVRRGNLYQIEHGKMRSSLEFAIKLSIVLEFSLDKIKELYCELRPTE